MSNDLKPVNTPMGGDGTVKRVPPRVQGIETLDGIEVGEPSAIPGVETRLIKKAPPQVGNTKITSSGHVTLPGEKINRPLTQQEKDILSRRSNHRRR